MEYKLRDGLAIGASFFVHTNWRFKNLEQRDFFIKFISNRKYKQWQPYRSDDKIDKELAVIIMDKMEYFTDKSVKYSGRKLMFDVFFEEIK